MITSSAYRPILCSTPPISIPKIVDVDLMACARGSITMAKIKGESGHPCLVPLAMLNGVDVIPDVQTRALGEEYRFSIAVRIVPDSPNLHMTFSMYFQLTLSNAFSASRERKGEVYVPPIGLNQ